MGGECNYLLRVSRGAERRLDFVPDEEWKSAAMMSWSVEAIQAMLTSAEAVLRDTASRLRLPVTVPHVACVQCLYNILSCGIQRPKVMEVNLLEQHIPTPKRLLKPWQQMSLHMPWRS